MRKNKVFEMFVLSAREIFQRGELPDDADTFFELVRQYSKNAIPDIKESELVEISNFMAHLTKRAPDACPRCVGKGYFIIGSDECKCPDCEGAGIHR